MRVTPRTVGTAPRAGSARTGRVPWARVPLRAGDAIGRRSIVPCSFRRTRMAYTEFRMTLLVEVKPDVERELAAQAACRGMDVTAYAASLLEQAARPAEPHQRRQTLSEFLMQSPLAGSGINVDRDRDPGRAIEL